MTDSDREKLLAMLKVRLQAKRLREKAIIEQSTQAHPRTALTFEEILEHQNDCTVLPYCMGEPARATTELTDSAANSE